LLELVPVVQDDLTRVAIEHSVTLASISTSPFFGGCLCEVVADGQSRYAHSNLKVLRATDEQFIAQARASVNMNEAYTCQFIFSPDTPEATLTQIEAELAASVNAAPVSVEANSTTTTDSIIGFLGVPELATPAPTLAPTTSAPTDFDPCNQIMCSAHCEDTCGWERVSGLCRTSSIHGSVTSATEREDRLGICPTGAPTTAPTTLEPTIVPTLGPTTDPCTIFLCAIYCEDSCGWDRLSGLCRTSAWANTHTSQTEIDERLGLCPSPTAVPTTRPSLEPSSSPTASPTSMPTQIPTEAIFDPCTLVPCARFCEDLCGWERLSGLCRSTALTGAVTSIYEIEDDLGDCGNTFPLTPTLTPASFPPSAGPTTLPTPINTPTTGEPLANPTNSAPTTAPSHFPTAAPSHFPTAAPVTSSPTSGPTLHNGGHGCSPATGVCLSWCTDQKWNGLSVDLVQTLPSARETFTYDLSRTVDGLALDSASVFYTYEQEIQSDAALMEMCPGIERAAIPGESGNDCGVYATTPALLVRCDYIPLKGVCGLYRTDIELMWACRQVCSAVPPCTAYSLDLTEDNGAPRAWCYLYEGLLHYSHIRQEGKRDAKKKSPKRNALMLKGECDHRSGVPAHLTTVLGSCNRKSAKCKQKGPKRAFNPPDLVQTSTDLPALAHDDTEESADQSTDSGRPPMHQRITLVIVLSAMITISVALLFGLGYLKRLSQRKSVASLNGTEAKVYTTKAKQRQHHSQMVSIDELQWDNTGITDLDLAGNVRPHVSVKSGHTCAEYQFASPGFNRFHFVQAHRAKTGKECADPQAKTGRLLLQRSPSRLDTGLRQRSPTKCEILSSRQRSSWDIL